MAKARIKNGYTKVANDLLEALAHTRLTPKQSRVLFFLMRMTYGWNGRKTAKIKTRDWETGTGLRKQHVYAALRQLQARNVVTKSGYQYGMNPHYSQWCEVTKSGYRCPNPVTKQGKFRSPEPVTLPIKENIVKERGVTGTGYKKNQKPESPHQSHSWPECKMCGTCQNGITVIEGVGCSRCKPELVD